MKILRSISQAQRSPSDIQNTFGDFGSPSNEPGRLYENAAVWWFTHSISAVETHTRPFRGGFTAVQFS
jgi:hypothetical protein